MEFARHGFFHVLLSFQFDFKGSRRCRGDLYQTLVQPQGILEDLGRPSVASRRQIDRSNRLVADMSDDVRPARQRENDPDALDRAILGEGFEVTCEQAVLGGARRNHWRERKVD